MGVGVYDFHPDRLIQARAARGINTQRALAFSLGVTPATVSRWEKGAVAPDAETLLKIANQLHLRPAFFLRPVIHTERPFFYRSLSSTLARDLNYQETQMRWLQEISQTIESYVDFPPIKIPDIIGDTSYKQLREADIEAIALELRRYWQLGLGPCVDMVSLLENIGCIVGSIEIGTSKLDGLCNWLDGNLRPYILLSTDKMSFPRRQMDAAHELGHAVLHRNVTPAELKADLKLIEKQVGRFASAFLMPEESYTSEVRDCTLESLLSLKERWRVSVKAQIYRLFDLGIIPEHYKISLYKNYSARGWSRGEPLDQQWSLSSPKLLANALRLIVESGTRTKKDLLDLDFTIQAGDIENLAALPPGWFSHNAEVIPLGVKGKSIERNGSGEVIAFRHRDK